ncbi:uncharacterized protein CG45076-like [Ptychodera flava]|uniref:uncharacterized protein CG45076-like n=1 Tax=Ptychodera flava TaxID=63121 RepID=UPI00396A303A
MTPGKFEEALKGRLDRAAKETTKKALEVHAAMRDAIKPTVKEGMENLVKGVTRVNVNETATKAAVTAEEKILKSLESYSQDQEAITKENAMSAVKMALEPAVKKALKKYVEQGLKNASEKSAEDVAETTSEEALKKAEDIAMTIIGESRVEEETEFVQAAEDYSSEEAKEAENAALRFYRLELIATVLVGMVSCLNIIISVFSGL